METKTGNGVGVPATASRGRGRPRDETLDEKILDAVRDLIDANEAVTVDAILARSGASKTTIYLRWPSLNDLIAAALDTGLEERADIPVDGDIRAAVVAASLPPFPDFPVQRTRQRLRLVLSDPVLQESYWHSSVSRRRAGFVQAIRAGIDAGVFRENLDVEACVDLISGLWYYHVVARGSDLDDPATVEQFRVAVEIVMRGMTPEDHRVS